MDPPPTTTTLAAPSVQPVCLPVSGTLLPLSDTSWWEVLGRERAQSTAKECGQKLRMFPGISERNSCYFPARRLEWVLPAIHAFNTQHTHSLTPETVLLEVKQTPFKKRTWGGRNNGNNVYVTETSHGGGGGYRALFLRNTHRQKITSI